MGTLISISACAAIIEDTVRLMKGKFKVSGGTGSSEDS